MISADAVEVQAVESTEEMDCKEGWRPPVSVLSSVEGTVSTMVNSVEIVTDSWLGVVKVVEGTLSETISGTGSGR